MIFFYRIINYSEFIYNYDIKILKIYIDVLKIILFLFNFFHAILYKNHY